MATEEAHEAVTSAERAVQTATERLARTAHEAVDTLSAYGERAEERLRDTGKTATERSRALIDEASAYVQQHPLAAVGIAVAVGFVVGALASRGSLPAHRSDELSEEEYP
jgi:ElaB/YqjD/DUF883 family membrane-anchored ribosome-binding protein